MSKVFPFFSSSLNCRKIKIYARMPKSKWPLKKIPAALNVDKILQECFCLGFFPSSLVQLKISIEFPRLENIKKLIIDFFTLSPFPNATKSIKREQNRKKVVYTFSRKTCYTCKNNKRKIIFTRGLSDKT